MINSPVNRAYFNKTITITIIRLADTKEQVISVINTECWSVVYLVTDKIRMQQKR